MANGNKLKIWGRVTSSNVKKVLCVADELKIPYERIEAGGKFGIVDTPEYRKLNPNGRVPTIEDGGYVLWESNSIMRYLAMKYGGAALYPAEPATRASVDRWLDWQLSVMVPADVPIFFGTIRTPPDKHDKAAIAAGAKKLAEVHKILDAALESKSYLVGDRLTLADIALGMYAHRYYANPYFEKAEFPHMKAWYERLRQWPPYKEHVDVPLE
jgi:glutathione S-transferase